MAYLNVMYAIYDMNDKMFDDSTYDKTVILYANIGVKRSGRNSEMQPNMLNCLHYVF